MIERDIVQQLREASLVSARWPLLFEAAADEIERLRALCGKADIGPSFAELTKDVPRRNTEPPER